MRAIMTYLALAWLAGLMLAANAGAIPDGFGPTILGLTLASVVFLYVCSVRAARWLAFGLLAGVFGWQRPVYVHTEVTVDDDDNEVTVYDDSDAATDDTYCDGGGSSDSRED